MERTLFMIVSSSMDREALVRLYDARVKGRWRSRVSWRQQSGWGTTKRLGSWHGVTLNARSRVERLTLAYNNCTGRLPLELGNLSQLTHLDLSFNKLKGLIPAELGDLRSLRELDLGHNGLDGTIPLALGNLSALRVLRLARNSLTGTIPELGKCVMLTTLDLSGNQLGGPIPSDLGKLQSLTLLDVSRNMLNGVIPKQLSALSALKGLFLGSNELTGHLPPELGLLSQLATLDLGDNMLTGEVPVSFLELKALQVLQAEQREGFTLRGNPARRESLEFWRSRLLVRSQSEHKEQDNGAVDGELLSPAERKDGDEEHPASDEGERKASDEYHESERSGCDHPDPLSDRRNPPAIEEDAPVDLWRWPNTESPGDWRSNHGPPGEVPEDVPSAGGDDSYDAGSTERTSSIGRASCSDSASAEDRVDVAEGAEQSSEPHVQSVEQGIAMPGLRDGPEPDPYLRDPESPPEVPRHQHAVAPEPEARRDSVDENSTLSGGSWEAEETPRPLFTAEPRTEERDLSLSPHRRLLAEDLLQGQLSSHTELAEVIREGRVALASVRKLVKVQERAKKSDDETSKEMMELKDKLEDLNRLVAMSKDLQHVAASMAMDKEVHRQEQHLYADPQLGAYYTTVRRGLCDAYLAACVIRSKLVSTSKTGVMSMVGTALEVVADSVPVAGGLGRLAGAALQAGDRYIQAGRLAKISDMAIDAQDCCWLARKVAFDLATAMKADIDAGRLGRAAGGMPAFDALGSAPAFSAGASVEWGRAHRAFGGGTAQGGNEEEGDDSDVVDWFAEQLAELDTYDSNARSSKQDVKAGLRGAKSHLTKMLRAVEAGRLDNAVGRDAKVSILVQLVLGQDAPAAIQDDARTTASAIPALNPPSFPEIPPERAIMSVDAADPLALEERLRTVAELKDQKDELKRLRHDVEILNKRLPAADAPEEDMDTGGGQIQVQKRRTSTKYGPSDFLKERARDDDYDQGPMSREEYWRLQRERDALMEERMDALSQDVDARLNPHARRRSQLEQDRAHGPASRLRRRKATDHGGP